MTRVWFGALVICLLVAVPSCSTKSHVPEAQSTRGPVAPSTGTSTTCGEAILRVTVDGRTIPLLSCAGLASTNPFPAIRLNIGDTITVVSGDAGAHLTLRSTADSVEIDQLRVTGAHVGSATVTVTGWSCAATAGAQPKTCPLLRVDVTG
jgi:hypothetical protein